MRALLSAIFFSAPRSEKEDPPYFELKLLLSNLVVEPCMAMIIFVENHIIYVMNRVVTLIHLQMYRQRRRHMKASYGVGYTVTPTGQKLNDFFGHLFIIIFSIFYPGPELLLLLKSSQPRHILCATLLTKEYS